jgi:hypothetical protein
MPRYMLPLVLMAACVTATSAIAHHSFTKYDGAKLVQATGTISNVRFQNPHIFFTIGSDGASWSVETEGSPVLQRQGLTADILKDGAKASISGWRSKDGSKALGLKSITINSRTFALRRSVR